METSFQIINGPALSDLCDYSFGDHHAAMDMMASRSTGIINLIGGFMKEANERNIEFLDKCKEFKEQPMTLYIDNLRLYNRPILANIGRDAEWVEYLLTNNDLLALCAKLDNKFIIFSHQEDTCIDENIKIPENVLGVHAVNAEYECERLFPFPFGVQRRMGALDNRHSILKDNIERDEYTEPSKLFYINCGIGRNEERLPLLDFKTNDWVTTHFDEMSMYFPYSEYQTYLDTIKEHKFMACPRGHANCYDTHKIWETLYLRRVPVVKDYPYFHRLLEGFPVLYIKEWPDVTEQMLKDNDDLYKQAQSMSLSKLNLNLIFKGIVKSYEI